MSTPRFEFTDFMNALEAAANQHGLIKDVIKGQSYQVGQRKNIDYPLCFIELDVSISVTAAVTTCQMAFQVLDQTQDKVDNQVGPLDKTYQIGKEILLLFYYNNQDTLLNLVEQPSWNALPMIQAYPDNVLGWRFEFTIEAPTVFNRCDIPLNEY